jgi:predicted DNA-binding transcriptional regulator AlpA
MSEIPDADVYLTDQQVCGLLHVGPRTTCRWRKDGDGPAYVRIGKHRILYRRSVIDQWMAQREYKHRAQEATKCVSRGDAEQGTI